MSNDAEVIPINPPSPFSAELPISPVPPAPPISVSTSGKRKGRPPGPGYKGPRAKPSAPDVEAGPSSPPPPFSGGPPHDTASAASPQAALRQIMVDPEKAGRMLVGVVDGLLTMLASTRYGQLIEPQSGRPLVELMAVSSKEKDDLVDAVVTFMKASSMAMSPGLNLAVAFGATYGSRAFALESARRTVMKGAA